MSNQANPQSTQSATSSATTSDQSAQSAAAEPAGGKAAAANQGNLPQTASELPLIGLLGLGLLAAGLAASRRMKRGVGTIS
ncbi:MAG: hypothetical protein DMG72_04535 [Acidobacteria bacterium]|nr:MAG: hypothetical protein DMG72_04535 [Acidobacteriota bacterium]